MGDNVKVAVRVRPFRELNMNSTLVIDMKGNQTLIKNPNDAKAQPKKFNFDYSYWSHDGFKERKDGYYDPKNDRYADQAKVFADLGKGVLDNAWKGYNCSLFAYGQTGSGKSYSMVGYKANKGIVPIVCDELFKAVEAKKKGAADGEEYQVTFSMLEIYNEQVRNLLDAESFKKKGGLKIRQHPQKGFFVDGVKTEPVKNYKAIENFMEKGTKNRTVASTNMNATSSRAHTIVAIDFIQKSKASGKAMTKSSSIKLVDLAGSERAQSTGAEGARLKEGAAINLSLTMLGNVIKALADNKKGAKVPFRDSKLTMLLQNALSGNSKTIMIAALSPAGVNYDETLSTLRFADRAKAIKTKAVVNENPTDKLIRELKEENKKLQEALKKGGAVGASQVDDAAVQEMQDLLKKNQEEMAGMEQSWQQKLQEKDAELNAMLEEERAKSEQQKTVPHLWNLHEDEALTAKVLHFVKQGQHRVGNRKATPPPDVPISGLSIQDEHAVIENKKDVVTLTPKGSARVLLNGNEISSAKVLHHHDRVMFGSNNLYVFHHPKDYAAQQKKGEATPQPSYESAQEEIAETSGLKSLMGGMTGSEGNADLIMQEDLLQLWPMVIEANALSEEMDQKVKFELALISPQARGKKEGKTEVMVKMKDLPTGNEFMWQRNEFIERKYIMQEMYQNFMEGDSIDVQKKDDPFWDDPDKEVLMGSVHVFLWSLAHVVELTETLMITDYRGQDNGQLQIAIYPCTKDGKELIDENDAFVEDPTELVGKELRFKIKIINARGLPHRVAKACCKFRFYLDDEPACTARIAGTMNPDFNYQKLYCYSPVTRQFLSYLQSQSLVVELWATQKHRTTSKSNLNTKELMTKDKLQNIGGQATAQKQAEEPMDEDTWAEAQYRLMAEASTYRKRMERAERKMRKVQELIETAHKKNSDTINVNEVEAILKAGYRMKAVARVIAQMEKAKSENMGSVTSGACVLQ